MMSRAQASADRDGSGVRRTRRTRVLIFEPKVLFHFGEPRGS
jgi:hypothetical protein